MRYLVWIVNDDGTDEQINQMYNEFYSITISLAYHDYTVVSPHVICRMAEIGYLDVLDWMPIGDHEARDYIADNRRGQM